MVGRGGGSGRVKRESERGGGGGETDKVNTEEKGCACLT